MSEGFRHIPVMANAVLAQLGVRVGGIYADGTLGGGGHSEFILQALDGSGHLYGIDRDPAAIAAATARLQTFANFTAIPGNFHDVLRLLPECRLDGGLLDLGVSSHQLDTPARGFSYHDDAPLDMRMDTSRGQTAAEYLANVSQQELTDVLYQYGDEKWAARIAKVVCEQRSIKPILTTLDLVRMVDMAIPRAVRQKDEGHPARRTFQAVRIAVNDEIDPLAQALRDWVSLLAPGGRLCVITFHSIEDRIVKQTFRALEKPCVCPPKAPICTCGRVSSGKALKMIAPDAEEIAQNPRARSAKLRVFEKA